MIKRLKVSNNLSKRSVQNLQRLRFAVDMLHDNSKNAKDSDVEASLCAVDFLRKTATAGKFVNYVFKQFDLKDDKQTVQFLKRLQKKHPDHAMPLHDLIGGVTNTQKVYQVETFNSKAQTDMPGISINPDISKSKALKVAQMFNHLFKEYIPEKYLKLQPYL